MLRAAQTLPFQGEIAVLTVANGAIANFLLPEGVTAREAAQLKAKHPAAELMLRSAVPGSLMGGLATHLPRDKREKAANAIEDAIFRHLGHRGDQLGLHGTAEEFRGAAEAPYTPIGSLARAWFEPMLDR